MKTGLTPLGAVFLFAFGILVLAACGCASFPKVEAAKWVHEGNYGPVTTHYEATGITRAPDGALNVKTYSGHIKVLGGYGISDTIEGLVVPAATR